MFHRTKPRELVFTWVAGNVTEDRSNGPTARSRDRRAEGCPELLDDPERRDVEAHSTRKIFERRNWFQLYARSTGVEFRRDLDLEAKAFVGKSTASIVSRGVIYRSRSLARGPLRCVVDNEPKSTRIGGLTRFLRRDRRGGYNRAMARDSFARPRYRLLNNTIRVPVVH